MKLKQLVIAAAIAFIPAAYATQENSKEVFLSYFPESLVTDALSRYNIPKEEWASINQDLSSKEGLVIRLVDEKASKMDPNPMEDPNQRKAAVKIFREVLFQVFSEVLYSHGVTDTDKIRNMLDTIQQLKAEKFCLSMKAPKYNGVDVQEESYKDVYNLGS